MHAYIELMSFEVDSEWLWKPVSHYHLPAKQPWASDLTFSKPSLLAVISVGSSLACFLCEMLLLSTKGDNHGYSQLLDPTTNH